MGFQVVGSKFQVNRSYHVWRHLVDGTWKCCLCGALATKPPEYDNRGWMPERFEALTAEDRESCPMHHQERGGR